MSDNTLTKEDFATEVKTDRLKILIVFSYGVCLLVALLVIIFGMTAGRSQMPTVIFAAAVTVSAVCFVAQQLLKRQFFTLAIWVFALGWAAGIAALFAGHDVQVNQIVPFVFPVIVFLVGLMLRPSHTFLMALVCAAVILAAGFTLPEGAAAPVGVQIASVSLVFLSALLSAQVSGELYQVTEWALLNYNRERRTNYELFEKRQQLQLSLKRSEVLGDQLRKINDALKEAHAAAEEAKHFRGQFLANMSHELRTPLNAIMGFSETMLKFPMMYDDQALPPVYEQDLKQIYSSGRQLLHVINDIIDLSKVDAGRLEIKLEAINPESVILATLSTARGLLADKPVKLEKDLPETLPALWVDESRLRQVLLNLYSNAAKYTDEGEIRLIVREIGEDVQFSLRDTGVGIDEEYHILIFEEFQQAKSAGRDPRAGSGLGLAISRQLVTLMGGRIWVESKPGLGSTFHFTVPLYRGQDKPGTTPDRDVTRGLRPAAISSKQPAAAAPATELPVTDGATVEMPATKVSTAEVPTVEVPAVEAAETPVAEPHKPVQGEVPQTTTVKERE